jgi:zinc transporter
VAVIHDVLFDFAFDPAGVSTVSLCVEPSYRISARLRPLRSVDRLRASVKVGQTFRSSADLLGHLLRDQAEVLVNIVSPVDHPGRLY